MSFTLPIVNWQLILPPLVVSLTAFAILMVATFRPAVRLQVLVEIGLAGIVLAFLSCLYLWNRGEGLQGFAGMVVSDRFAMAFNFIFLLGAFLAFLTSLNRVEGAYVSYGEFYAFILFATAGMMLMAASTHLLTIFLSLEVLSLGLYVLTGFRKMRLRSVEAALKYFLLGAFATGFFLYGVALVYGATGSLHLKEIASFMGNQGLEDPLLIAGGLLLLIGFGFKAAFVPFHMWTPDVYEGAPTPITAFMSVGTKAAAFAALVRVLLAITPTTAFDWTPILWVLAALTMTVGNIIAIVQNNIKRLLAYSSIAQAGYVLVGVVAWNEPGWSSVLFYLLVYALMNIGAFAVVIFMGVDERHENLNLEDYRGMGYRHPLVGLAMSVFMFSLAGIPPTAGFVGKFYLFSAAVKAGFTGLVIIAVLNSVISVYYYLRVVVMMYMRESERPVSLPSIPVALAVALVITTAGVIKIGLFPSGLLKVFQEAVSTLM